MQQSLEQFVDAVAARGSWVGGGGVAAVSAALAAALLEKLAHRPTLNRRLRRLRTECLFLGRRDGQVFAEVIAATRRNDRRAFVRCLKAATAVPQTVFEHAQTVQAACRAVQRSIKPRFRSDLRCAMALARAAALGAGALIQTNLAWLDEPAYAAQVRRRLRRAAGRHVR